MAALANEISRAEVKRLRLMMSKVEETEVDDEE